MAGPAPIRFADLLRAAAGAVGSRTRFVPVPLALVVAARRLRSARPAPRIRAEQLQRLAEDKAFRIDEAVRDLDYAPRPFADGIQAEAAALGLARGRMRQTAPRDVARFARTVVRLRPAQVTQRVRLRGQRVALTTSRRPAMATGRPGPG